MAIVERRDIEFDAEAVLRAVTCGSRAAQTFGLPPLRATCVHFLPAQGQVEVVYGTGGAARAFPLRAEALGALLVSYCIRVRVPMPRRAEKGIRVEGASVVLTFRTQFDQAPEPQLPEGTITRTPEAVKTWSWVDPGSADPV